MIHFSLRKLKACNISMMIASLFFLFSCKPGTTKKDEIILTGDPAINELTEAIRKSPNDPELYLRRAELFYEQQAYDQAIDDLGKLMKLDSTNLEAHHLLADVYLDDFQSARALTTMQRAGSLYPDSIGTKLKLSEFQLILKQYDQALQTLADIMKIHPGNPEALFMLGMVYRDQGKLIWRLLLFKLLLIEIPT